MTGRVIDLAPLALATMGDTTLLGAWFRIKLVCLQKQKKVLFLFGLVQNQPLKSDV
jgi:hypothetical protein